MIPESILSFFHAGKALPFRSMTYFNFLLEATLAGSILILVVLVLRRVFRRQVGSRLVYLAWALVAIRLLLPVAIPNPLMDEFRPTYSTDAEARPVADQFRVRYQDAMGDVSRQLQSSASEGQSTTSLQNKLSTLTLDLAAYTAYGWLGKGYLLCYGVGGLIVLTVFAARHIRFRGRLKKRTVNTLEGQQLALYQDLCKRLGVKQLPVIYVDPLPSPCLVGVFRPVIALPLTLPPESLSESLMHELSHYKAKDPWWVLLRCVCCAVHWFNPLVWIAQRFVRMDCELACDQRVAAKLTQEERLHYANTLVTTALQAYAPRAGVLATGMTMTGKRLKRRVNAILHMKAVRKVAAALLAVLLMVLLTVAAFSTAESTEQTKRLTSDTSAFPFEQGYTYPAPASVFGEPVALVPLLSATEAEAQAKRYLCALYPEDQAAIETQYSYHVQSFGKNSWEIVIWPPEGGASLYYMELKSAGGLVSVYRTDTLSNGEGRTNTPSVLPDNLKSVLLEYGRQVSGAVLQGARLDQAMVHSDMDTAEGRYLVYDLVNADGSSQRVSLTVQIAPTFCLVGVYNLENNGVINPDENPPIEQGLQTLVYSEEPSIRFNAVFWGQTDNQYALSPEATLTVQQAFDIAVEAILERSGLSREALLLLPLGYGYYDKSNYDGDVSTWRFVWQVDPDDPMNRYWVDFSDLPAPENVGMSMPGEGLG